MSSIPAETKRGFLIVIGVIAGLYVANMVLRRLP